MYHIEDAAHGSLGRPMACVPFYGEDSRTHLKGSLDHYTAQYGGSSSRSSPHYTQCEVRANTGTARTTVGVFTKRKEAPYSKNAPAHLSTFNLSCDHISNEEAGSREQRNTQPRQLYHWLRKRTSVARINRLGEAQRNRTWGLSPAWKMQRRIPQYHSLCEASTASFTVSRSSILHPHPLMLAPLVTNQKQIAGYTKSKSVEAHWDSKEKETK